MKIAVILIPICAYQLCIANTMDSFEPFEYLVEQLENKGKVSNEDGFLF